jgi:hypothetical protein
MGLSRGPIVALRLSRRFVGGDPLRRQLLARAEPLTALPRSARSRVSLSLTGCLLRGSPPTTREASQQRWAAAGGHPSHKLLLGLWSCGRASTLHDICDRRQPDRDRNSFCSLTRTATPLRWIRLGAPTSARRRRRGHHHRPTARQTIRLTRSNAERRKTGRLRDPLDCW